MILIHCPSAGCYWGTATDATVEQASASFIEHWRGKHEPLDQSPDKLPIDQGPTVPATTPAKRKKPGSSVSLIVRDYSRREPEMDDRGLTSGGTPPEDFWNRPDDYPKAKRDRMKPKKMGRPL